MGFERLEAAFACTGDRSPGQMVETVLAELRSFTADTPQHDDMTLVAVQVCGQATRPYSPAQAG